MFLQNVAKSLRHGHSSLLTFPHHVTIKQDPLPSNVDSANQEMTDKRKKTNKLKSVNIMKKMDKMKKTDKPLQILTTWMQEQFWGTFTKVMSRFFTSAHFVRKLLSTNQHCTITFKSCITTKKIDKKLPNFHSSSKLRSSKPQTICS